MSLGADSRTVVFHALGSTRRRPAWPSDVIQFTADGCRDDDQRSGVSRRNITLNRRSREPLRYHSWDGLDSNWQTTMLIRLLPRNIVFGYLE